MKFKYVWFIVAMFCFISKAESTINDLNYYQSQSIIYVNVETSIELSDKVIEAIKNGLTLNVGYLFKLYESKWYSPFSFTEVEKNYVISYDSISSTFILKNPVTNNKNNFSNVSSLLHQLSNLRDFPLISNSHLQNKKVMGKVRFQLNTSNLPVYLKADVLLSSEWDINSDWYQWQLN